MLVDMEQSRIVAQVMAKALPSRLKKERAAQVLGCSYKRVGNLCSGSDSERNKATLVDLRMLALAGLIEPSDINDLFADCGFGGMHFVEPVPICPIEISNTLHNGGLEIGSRGVDGEICQADNRALQPMLRRVGQVCLQGAQFLKMNSAKVLPLTLWKRRAAE